MAKKLTLVENSVSKYQIVVPQNATEAENYAAEELACFLEQISGCSLRIVTDASPLSCCEILLGLSNSHLHLQNFRFSGLQLASEEFIIQTENNCLAIVGGQPRGLLYGVYTFLEDYLGCRWFSSTVSHIPKRQVLSIPAIMFRHKPVF